MNFITVLEELDRLYEADEKKDDKLCSVIVDDKLAFEGTRKDCEKWMDENQAVGNHKVVIKDNTAPVNEALDEDDDETDIDIIDDESGAGETSADEPSADEPEAEAASPADVEDDETQADAEASQLVLKCENCGALHIKAEPDVEIEDTGLANVKESCSFCDEADGYAIIGNFIPAEADEEIPAEPVDDDGNGDVAEAEAIEEGIFDFGKKKRDRETAQRAEEERVAELNRKADRVNSKPYVSDYERMRKERESAAYLKSIEQESRDMAARAAKSGSIPSPSNTPYVGVSYSGGDYF